MRGPYRPPPLLIAAGLLSIPAAKRSSSNRLRPVSPTRSPNIPDQKLDAAGSPPLERVASLKQDYQQRIAAGGPPSDQGAQLANEASMALAKAVTDSGALLAGGIRLHSGGGAETIPRFVENNCQRIRPSAK